METHKQYTDFVTEVKVRIRSAQYDALKAVNKELLRLYWDIGKMIDQKQKEQGWGKSVVERLAIDLQTEFPGERGYSASNLWFMVRLYHEYQEHIKLVSMIQEIGWSHNIMILKKCKHLPERQFYLMATKRFGWTTRVLDLAQLRNQIITKSKIPVYRVCESSMSIVKVV